MVANDPHAGDGLTHEMVLLSLERRDTYDSERKVAPLRCPPGAFTVDTTGLSIKEVVTLIVNEYKRVSLN